MDNSMKILGNVNPNEYFVLKNGRILKNLYELTNSLISMDDDTFAHHVNNERNDFANWIKYVFLDENLANQISRLKSKKAIIKRIKKSLSKASKAKIRVERPKFDFKKSEKIAVPEKIISNDGEILNKIKEVLSKERELEKREEKILEIESRIEGKLAEERGKSKDDKFFSKEFIQGLVAGFLIALILALIYIKYFYP